MDSNVSRMGTGLTFHNFQLPEPSAKTFAWPPKITQICHCAGHKIGLAHPVSSVNGHLLKSPCYGQSHCRYCTEQSVVPAASRPSWREPTDVSYSVSRWHDVACCRSHPCCRWQSSRQSTVCTGARCVCSRQMCCGSHSPTTTVMTTLTDYIKLWPNWSRICGLPSRSKVETSQ